jgi:hypothetical protein
MPPKANMKDKDKLNIGIGSPSVSSQNPVQESSGSGTTRATSGMAPKSAAHILGAPPVIHNLPKSRAVSAAYKTHVAKAANLNPTNKSNLHWLVQTAAMGFKGSASGQGQQSPFIPLISGQPTTTHEALEANILAGLDDPQEEMEVEYMASPEKRDRDYSSSEYEQSNTGFLRQPPQRCVKSRS